MGQAGSPQVDTSAVGARLHGFVPEVAGDHAQRELGPTAVPEAREVRGADGDYPGVAAAAR